MTAKRLLLIGLVALVVAEALAQTAPQQRNGQPKRIPRRGATLAATSQPAVSVSQAPAPPMPLNGALAVNNRLRNPANPGSPPPNVVLQQYSYFAVAEPEPQQIRVNDTITVVIREDKTATSDASMDSEKNWDIAGELSQWLCIENNKIVTKTTNPNPGVTFEYTDEYDGQGTMDRRDSLATRLQARVIDVKPNGNLVIEAKKSIKIDDDGYTITFTGECRAIDVTPANTVLSTQVADAAVRVEHFGAVRAATRRGWLKKAWDYVTPF